MATSKLGRMMRVDLREVWSHEGTEFTPWLSREENIALLGDAIGLTLEVESQEKGVGPFRADILCKDVDTERWVLVENQLERTDHVHLGQLLTYAAGLNAVTVVWIADRFTEEHRAALDWLNNITSEEFQFFGLEIELWKIESSPIAPKFNVVSKPNDWSKRVSESAAGGVSDIKRLQFDYWSALRALMDDRGGLVRPKSPRPQHWMTFAIGSSKSHLAAYVNTREASIGVELTVGGANAKQNFRALLRHKEDIEKEIGSPLEWEENPEKKSSYIALIRDDFDPTDRETWQEQHDWIFQQLQLFHRAFAQRVRDLGDEELSGDLIARAVPE
jgi:hypothetical protein